MTLNTREWEKEFDEQFKGKIQQNNTPDGITVTRLKHFIYQELQKAREETERAVWERIRKEAKRDETGMYMFYLADQSELDQLNK